MKLSLRVALLPAALLLPLVFASPVLASESALVGKLKQDGTVQLFQNRFQDHFADGTEVASIEAVKTGGDVHIRRRSADGCLVQSSQLDIDPVANPDGSHSLWQVTAHPLSVFRCEDNGCAQVFTEGAWTASCGNFGSVEPIIRCICIRRNFDQVIGEAGDYCKQRFLGITLWDLTDWVLPQFVQ